MRALVLYKDNEKKFYEVLAKFGEVWAPVKKEDNYVYSKVTDTSKLSLSITDSYNRTILPIKKFLMPQEFNMLSCTPDRFVKAPQDIPVRIALGVHPCDISAVNILDVFYSKDFVDPFYKERREKLIIIGSICKPDEHCFCNETKTVIVEEGFDLFFNDLGDYFLVWIGSGKGYDIIREAGDIFEEKISEKVVDNFIKQKREGENCFTNDISLVGIMDLMELKYNANFWEELGEKCLGCGQCTMVCPTCTCFNVIDDLDLNKESGKRRRYWDSCMFKDYSLCAGGHNFRKNRGDRLKLWYTHKLKAFIGHFGSPSCVGCGRCLVTCPVDINIKTVVKKLNQEVTIK